MSSRSRILVTGASGFVGSHIVDQLLRTGYAVRGVSRSAKAEQLRKNCSDPNFEVTVVDDLIAGDFSEALRSIAAVIHVASPLPWAQDIKLEVAIGSTTNVIRQAYAKNVYKVILVSSLGTTFTAEEEINDGSRVITNKDWRKVTEEDVKPDAPGWEVYLASKTLAERAAWDFAESHPELDLTTILPPCIYGPLAPAHVVSDPSLAGLSTNHWLYQLVTQPTATYPDVNISQAVDVRDVATAAVRALSVPKPLLGEQQQQRRILLHGGSFTWTDAVRHLAHVRPELKGRLVEGGNPLADQGDATSVANLDTTTAKEVLGIASFIDWHQMVEDAMDSMIQREATWVNTR